MWVSKSRKENTSSREKLLQLYLDCRFVSIARYLIENGADLTAINSDGELAIDLASTNSMADHLQTIYDENGIDCDHARQSEEQIMLSDAKKWLRSDASEADKPHPKTGATALHVAAAKGYTKVKFIFYSKSFNSITFSYSYFRY